MTITRYQLDPTGVNPNNLVVGENATVRVDTNTTILTGAGAYYTESLVIYDSSNLTTPLVRDIDYACLQLVEDATAKYGKEICQIILFYKNPLISSININYQAVGGYYEYQTDNINELYDRVLASGQDVGWFNLLNKPLTFIPANHINMLEDIYGFEPVIYALERIREVIGLSNSTTVQSLLNIISSQYSNLNKTPLGLDQVDNTSDLNKPLSSAAIAALSLKADSTTVSDINSSLTSGLNNKVDKTTYLTDQAAINTRIDNIPTISIIPGTIDLFASRVVPTGWALLDATPLKIADNPTLYNLYQDVAGTIPDIAAIRGSIANIVPPMTGFNTPAGYSITASVSISSAGTPTYEPWKAFDGVLLSDTSGENAWLTPPNTTAAWLSVTLPAAKVLTNYIVLPGNMRGNWPSSWDMLGYTTGGVWVNLQHVDAQTYWDGSVSKSFTISDTSLKYACTQFKFNITSFGGSTGQNESISELTMIGSNMVYKQAPAGYFYLPDDLNHLPAYPDALRYIKLG